jgi:hypothetical protein
LRQLATVLLLLASQAAWSAEAKPTLEEKRLGVIRGTTPGIVIFDFGAAKKTEPPASSNAGAEARPASEAAAPAGWRPKWLSALPAPSGRSLQAARRLDAPDQGIALPTAATASQARRSVKAVPSRDASEPTRLQAQGDPK